MQKGTAMTKYFSKDTPLASLERMMMSVPGFQKRGGGMMVLCRFHYKKEDVDCAYCQSYMRHTCQASVCPYIPERLEAGTVSYQELAEGCLHMAGHQKLWNRLSSLPKGKSLPLVLEPAHRRRLSEWLEAGIATSCPHELAAAYLLSSRAGLWRRVLPHISHGRIDFSSISLRGIDPRDYPVYRAAKGLYCGTLLITSSELADEEQVSSEAFGDILNAMLIARYPRLVTDEEFLAVRLRRREQNTYAPCPSEIIPIRNKAVCALCGEKMTRDTKSHGRPRWRCKNPECGGSVYLDDSIILERVMQKLKVLAHSPEHIQLPKAAPVSTDALRIENELALCFNRADINPEYMKTLIMAAAAERYAGLNDPTPTHKLELLRQKLELEPESEETLWEVFESAVAQVRIGKGGEISLHQKDQKECAL